MLDKIADNELDTFLTCVRLEFKKAEAKGKDIKEKISAKLDVLYEGVESFGEKEAKAAVKKLS